MNRLSELKVCLGDAFVYSFDKPERFLMFGTDLPFIALFLSIYARFGREC